MTIALAMVLLMGVAAVAIDLGVGWNERRQDQTSSDLATVAGALSFADQDAIVNEVLSTSLTNVDSTFSNAEWEALWTSCLDSDRPPGFLPITSSTLGVIDCISVNPSFLRVRLPDQVVATSFGRVIGSDQLTTHADTIVTLLDGDGTGLLPFAVRGDAGAGEICLDTGTGQIDPPCDGNESGSFGNIAPPLFGNPFLPTTPECSNQSSANNHVAESIAMGIDHLLFTFTQAQWTATGWNVGDNTSNNTVDAQVNMDECNDTGGELAEAADGVPIEGVYIDTGNNVKADTTEGLITGVNFQDGGDARLTRSSVTRDLDGYDLDNIPLWTHLMAAGGATGHGVAVCDGPTIRAEPDLGLRNDLMRTCLETYASNGETAQIFADTILGTPRLGVAPRIWHTGLGSGLSFRPIKSFDVVYIAGIWLNDAQGPTKPATVFYPDENDSSDITPNKNNWVVEQVTAWLLLPDMVSDTVLAIYPGLTNEFQPSIYQ